MECNYFFVIGESIDLALGVPYGFVVSHFNATKFAAQKNIRLRILNVFHWLLKPLFVHNIVSVIV